MLKEIFAKKYWIFTLVKRNLTEFANKNTVILDYFSDKNSYSDDYVYDENE